MSSTSKFAKGLFFGALAGIAAGVLLAPEKGEKTRQKLKEKKHEWEPRLKELADLFKKDVLPFLEGLAENAEPVVQKAKQTALDAGQNIRKFSDEVRQEAQEVAEQATERFETKASETPQADTKGRRFFRRNK